MISRSKFLFIIFFFTTFGIINLVTVKFAFAQDFLFPNFFDNPTPTPSSSKTTPTQAPKPTPSQSPKSSPAPSASPTLDPTTTPGVATPTPIQNVTATPTPLLHPKAIEPIQIIPTTPPLYLTQEAQISDTPTPTPTPVSKTKSAILKIVPIGKIEDTITSNFYASTSFSPLATTIIMYFSLMLFGVGVILAKWEEMQSAYEKVRNTLHTRLRTTIHIS